jgi:hypothetical protein
LPITEGGKQETRAQGEEQGEYEAGLRACFSLHVLSPFLLNELGFQEKVASPDRAG